MSDPIPDDLELPRSFPIFPLSEVLLVPGAFLPLHIFEPRYRSMLAHAMAGDRMIGMALPVRGHSTDDEAEPPVHPVCGLGRVVHHRRHRDGGADIVLAGLARMHIQRELPTTRPYRLVSAVPLPDLLPEDGEDLAPRAEALLARLHEVDAHERKKLAELPVARLVDLIVLRLPAPVVERHRIHSIQDVALRLEETELLLSRLCGAPHPLDLRESDPRLN